MILLLEGNYFTGEYAISPSETKAAWTSSGATSLTSDNMSYAMLRLNDGTALADGDGPGLLGSEWQDTLNTEAAVLGDRNTGTNTTTAISSIHTDENEGDWRGSVAWNDNHVVFETEPTLSTKYGQYNNSDGDDNLFEEAATSETNADENGVWVFQDATTLTDQD